MNSFLRHLILIGLIYLIGGFLLSIYAQESTNNWEQEYGIEDVSEEDEPDIESEENEIPLLPDWIKGYFYIQHQEYQYRNNNPLNPENKLFDFKTYKKSTLLDIELNPSLTDNLKFYSKDQLRYQKSDLDSNSQHYSQEVYLQWLNDSQSVVVNTGKLKTEWGSGYYWNPVQLLIPNHDENTDTVYEDEGLNMIFIEFSTEPVTTTFILAELDDQYSNQKDRTQTALKIAISMEPWDIALFSHQATNQKLSSALSFSGLITDAFEFHGEWAGTYQRDRDVPVQKSKGVQYPGFYLPGRYDYEEDQRDVLFQQYLIGIQYTFQIDMNIILEYYYSDHGYNQKEWDTIKDGVEEAHQDDAWEKNTSPYTSSQGNPYPGFLKNTMSEIGKGNLRQNYLFLRYDSGEFEENWSFEQILILNIDDQSQIHQSEIDYNWMDELEITGSVNVFKGDTESEFGMNPYQHYFTIKVEYNY